MRMRSLFRLSYASFALCAVTYVLAFFLTGYPSQNTRLLDTTQAEQIRGYAFSIKLLLPGVPSDASLPFNSPMEMTEDGSKIGPPHMPIESVANSGGGAFIHLQDRLVFSTSDNSDPGSNKRRYEITFKHGLPLWRIAAVSTVSF